MGSCTNGEGYYHYSYSVVQCCDRESFHGCCLLSPWLTSEDWPGLAVQRRELPRPNLPSRAKHAVRILILGAANEHAYRSHPPRKPPPFVVPPSHNHPSPKPNTRHPICLLAPVSTSRPRLSLARTSPCLPLNLANRARLGLA